MCQDFAEYLFDTQWAKKIPPKIAIQGSWLYYMSSTLRIKNCSIVGLRNRELSNNEIAR